MTLAAMLKKPQEEYDFFLLMPRDMRVLLITNMIYAFVLPVIEIFVGAYIMRSSNDPKIVAIYQLTVYTGIPITFLINGFLLSRIKISNLYSFGMLLSGLSMLVMMSLDHLSVAGVGIAGILMGCSFGFFWSNRDFLALNTTQDSNRNYYYGLETFFYTLTFILVPVVVGAYLSSANSNQWFAGNMNRSYQVVTIVVFLLTILSSVVIHKEKFKNPIQKRFLYFRFHSLWKKMLGLAGLKGLAQGYLVTAPAILIMRMVGDEGSLGLVQGSHGINAVSTWTNYKTRTPDLHFFSWPCHLLAWNAGKWNLILRGGRDDFCFVQGVVSTAARYRLLPDTDACNRRRV